MAMAGTAGLLSAASVALASTLSSRRGRLPNAVEVYSCRNVQLHSWRVSSKCIMCLKSSSSVEDHRPADKPSGESCVFQISACSRRELLFLPTIFLAALVPNFGKDERILASEFVDMPALRGKDYGKPKMRYPDYILTESGLQFKDLRVGTGPTPKKGETVVVDWDGYTIGYYGRIFEARNKAKGGSFEGDEKNYLKVRLGTDEVIPAFEEAISTMSLGGVRRIIVPPELGYPDNDFNKKGPRPTTFSGQRALAFVLQNQNLIDKTLLFDIELLKISPS